MKKFDVTVFFQKYVCRAAHRLHHEYLLFGLVGGGAYIVASLTAAVFIMIHATANQGGLWVLLLLIVPILVLGVASVANIEYNEAYDAARDRKLASELHKILTQTGPLPGIALQAHYNRQHWGKIRIETLTQLVINNKETADLFKYRATGNILTNSWKMRAQDCIITPNASFDGERFEVPQPLEGDYVAGYYQLYARLKAIRNHPELARVQDSLIDDLYGIG